jgi:uncharacterized repeat protein (TIGR01451 family)
MNAGSIINSATATAVQQNNKTITSNIANVMVVATQNLQLSLTKTASVTTAFTTGIKIDYTYTLKNTGNITLSGPYIVTDDTLSNVDCSGAIGSMLPLGTRTCTATHVTIQSDLDEGSIINHANATAKFNTQTVTSNDASAKVITFAGPRLRLQKTASPPTMSRVAGQTITYTYTLKNTGGIDLTAPYNVTDDKISVVDCSSAAATLTPGDTTTCKGTYVTTIDDVSSGAVTNTAIATAGSSGGTITSNQTIATVPVYACDGTTLTFGPFLSSSDVIWTINNSSSTEQRVSSISIQWSNAPSVTLIRGPGREYDLVGYVNQR